MNRLASVFARVANEYRAGLESSHALAALEAKAQEMREDRIIVVNVSGLGDKDIFTVADALGVGL